MSAAETRHSATSAHSFLLIPILLLFALLVVAVLRSPSLITSSGIGSAIIVAAPLILAAYALTAVVMAGRGGVDLSIGPLIGFLNVTLVQLYAEEIVTSVVDVFLYAIAVGIAYQIIMGLIIIYVRIQPIIVALAGFLTLAGLNLIILPRPGGVSPPWMSHWGLGESIWSPVLAILVIATGAWFLFTRTAFYNHLRLMGADERTAYTAGVNIVAVRLGAHALGGVYAGLAAICFTALIGSGDPTQGSTYTLMAVTALVLGGTSLAGGRGSIIGSLLGALNIYLITYVLATFNFGMVQSFVTQLSYGVILMVALLLTILLPQIRRTMRSVSPYVLFVLLGLAAFGVTLYARDVVMAPVGQSLSEGMTSLSDSVGQSLSGTSLSGESLSGQSLSGESLSGQSLSGESLAGTSLSAEAEAEAAPEPTATPIMVTAVVIAVVVFLLYMLVRYINIWTVALVGVVALLVLGYSVYDGGVPEPRVPAVAAAGPAPFVFDIEAPEVVAAVPPTWILESPWLAGALFVAGAILLGTVLIFTTVPHVRARVGETAMVFMALAGVAVAAVFVYAGDGLGIGGDNLFIEALGAIVVGALLFIVTLPTFQQRIRNISLVMLTLLSIIALVTTFLAAAPDMPAAGTATVATDAGAVPPAGIDMAAAEAAGIGFSGFFDTGVFVVLLAGTILFLLMIGGVRRHVMQNITFAPGVRTFSYTGIFIAATATIAMGAVFLIADVAIWKFIVALIAGLIGARFAFHFLRDFRRKYGGMLNDGPDMSDLDRATRGFRR